MSRVEHPYRHIVLPMLLSVGALSWLILLVSLAIIALVILAPAYGAVHDAQVQRNVMQATLAQYDEKIDLQNRFIQTAASDPRLMQRLADRQMDVVDPSEQVLELAGVPSRRDVQSLIDEAVAPITPVPVAAVPWWIKPVLFSPVRNPLLVIALAGLLVSFLLEIRRRDVNI